MIFETGCRRKPCVCMGKDWRIFVVGEGTGMGGKEVERDRCGSRRARDPWPFPKGIIRVGRPFLLGFPRKVKAGTVTGMENGKENTPPTSSGRISSVSPPSGLTAKRSGIMHSARTHQIGCYTKILAQDRSSAAPYYYYRILNTENIFQDGNTRITRSLSPHIPGNAGVLIGIENNLYKTIVLTMFRGFFTS